MDDKALLVQNLSKDFKLPHERKNSVKDWVLHFHKPKYEKFHVLKNINFEVKKGEFFGIVGRNGSGKSTLLKMIGGIYQPTKGQLNVNGTLTPFIELGIGFNPELTGRENVFLNGAIMGLTRKEIQSKYQSIVDFSELDKFMDQKLKNYSSGMQVRLAFSIAIQAHNDILLIDEVLAVGDENFQRKCFSVFNEIKDSGKTVIFVTHDMGSVKRFCDRGMLLDNGKISLIGSPEEIAYAYQELNLKSAASTSEEPEYEKGISISVKLKKYDKNKNELIFKIAYKNKPGNKVYVGFSLVKEGATVAEMNNLKEATEKTEGEFEYTLNTSMLNPGVYEIAAGLIGYKDKQLLKAVPTDKWISFIVPGDDNRRGGAIHLPDNWS